MAAADSQNILDTLNGNSNVETLDEQRDVFLDGKPDNGEVAHLGDMEVFYQSARTSDGANLFVYGEIEENDLTGETVLREPREETADRIENYFRIKYNLRDFEETQITVQMADYEEVGEYANETYFKLK